MPPRVLVDCDPGIDDALALFALLGSDSVVIQAVTTVFGNVTVKQATRNLARLWRFVPHRPVPRIGEGADEPLIGSRLPRRSIHGHDGLGDLGFPAAAVPRPLPEGTAVITGLLHSQEVDTILALGPLTNVAHAFARMPRAMRQLKGIVVMGGVVATERGLGGTEFNLASDPAAARCLLGSQAALRWVPWNVAASVVFSLQAIERFEKAHSKSALGRAMAGLLGYAARAREGLAGALLPDAVAAALAVEPTAGVWRQRRVMLEARTRSGRVRCEAGIPNVQLCEAVDAGRVERMLWEAWECLLREEAMASGEGGWSVRR